MGRPPKENRSEVADITRSLRFSPIEIEALKRLTERRAAELRASGALGATVTSTSLAQGIVRRELETSGVYAEVVRDMHAGKLPHLKPPTQAALFVAAPPELAPVLPPNTHAPAVAAFAPPPRPSSAAKATSSKALADKPAPPPAPPRASSPARPKTAPAKRAPSGPPVRPKPSAKPATKRAHK